VLKKFLKGDWDLDHSGDDFLYDKILLEFPLFSLNDDYLRALTNIIYSKIEQMQNIINQKNDEVQNMVANREMHEKRKLRENSLSLIKSKINDRSLEREGEQKIKEFK
jgi:hypothetical protein